MFLHSQLAPANGMELISGLDPENSHPLLLHRVLALHLDDRGDGVPRERPCEPIVYECILEVIPKGDSRL